MKESYSEDVASHAGPESCAGAREGVGEALTGAYVGQVLSREINLIGVPMPSQQQKATSGVAPRRAAPGPPRSEALCMHAKHLAREPGDPAFALCVMAPGPRWQAKSVIQR